jgi:hypothetical protein
MFRPKRPDQETQMYRVKGSGRAHISHPQKHIAGILNAKGAKRPERFNPHFKVPQRPPTDHLKLRQRFQFAAEGRIDSLHHNPGPYGQYHKELPRYAKGEPYHEPQKPQPGVGPKEFFSWLGQRMIGRGPDSPLQKRLAEKVMKEAPVGKAVGGVAVPYGEGTHYRGPHWQQKERSRR